VEEGEEVKGEEEGEKGKHKTIFIYQT